MSVSRESTLKPPLSVMRDSSYAINNLNVDFTKEQDLNTQDAKSKELKTPNARYSSETPRKTQRQNEKKTEPAKTDDILLKKSYKKDTAPIPQSVHSNCMKGEFPNRIEFEKLLFWESIVKRMLLKSWSRVLPGGSVEAKIYFEKPEYSGSLENQAYGVPMGYFSLGSDMEDAANQDVPDRLKERIQEVMNKNLDLDQNKTIHGSKCDNVFKTDPEIASFETDILKISTSKSNKSRDSKGRFTVNKSNDFENVNLRSKNGRDDMFKMEDLTPENFESHGIVLQQKKVFYQGTQNLANKESYQAEKFEYVPENYQSLTCDDFQSDEVVLSKKKVVLSRGTENMVNRESNKLEQFESDFFQMELNASHVLKSNEMRLKESRNCERIDNPEWDSFEKTKIITNSEVSDSPSEQGNFNLSINAINPSTHDNGAKEFDILAVKDDVDNNQSEEVADDIKWQENTSFCSRDSDGSVFDPFDSFEQNIKPKLILENNIYLETHGFEPQDRDVIDYENLVKKSENKKDGSLDELELQELDDFYAENALNNFSNNVIEVEENDETTFEPQLKKAKISEDTQVDTEEDEEPPILIKLKKL